MPISQAPRTPDAYTVLDWMVRTHTATWMEAAGLSDLATELRHLPQLTDDDTTQRAAPLLRRCWRVAADACTAATRRSSPSDWYWTGTMDVGRDRARESGGDSAYQIVTAAGIGGCVRTSALHAARAAATAAVWSSHQRGAYAQTADELRAGARRDLPASAGI